MSTARESLPLGRPRGASVWSITGQTDPDGAVRKIALVQEETSVGRRPDLQICLASPSVSKLHAKLKIDGPRLFVEDMGSTNGSYVNGERLSAPCELKTGDIVQFATTVFRVGNEASSVTENVTVEGDALDQALSLMQFERLMDGNAIIPFYQPIVPLDDPARRDAYEILGRSRLLGLSSPGEMFSTALQLDQEAALSRQLRLKGIQVAQRFAGNPTLYVNTHPAEVLDHELTASLETLREINPDGDMTLEIHEGAVTDPAGVRVLREHLSGLGMELAFDDFGAGQARLVELSEVRPDCIKFDMQLVQGIHSAPASRQEVVGMLVRMVNELGITSLAEGVELQEDHETLVQMGVKLGQGFYYGRPASINDHLKQHGPLA